MRKWLIVLALISAGCERQEISAEKKVNEYVVLLCKGTTNPDSPNLARASSHLIRASTNNFHRSLEYYDDRQARFVSPCESTKSVCSLNSSLDIIQEDGSLRDDNGKPLKSEISTINRRTGEMVSVVHDSTGKWVRFQGVCEKSDAPKETQQKF